MALFLTQDLPISLTFNLKCKQSLEPAASGELTPPVPALGPLLGPGFWSQEELVETKFPPLRSPFLPFPRWCGEVPTRPLGTP